MQDEQERELSIKSMPMCLALQDSNGKSFAFNIIDTPGHPNFEDKALSAIRLSDGALIIVDLIEGVMIGTKRMIKSAIREGLEIIVIFNKNG